MDPLFTGIAVSRRLTHWINAIALTILFMSGMQIFTLFRISPGAAKPNPNTSARSNWFQASSTSAKARGGYWEDQGYEWYAGI
jgi:hypothetical protein